MLNVFKIFFVFQLSAYITEFSVICDKVVYAGAIFP